MKDRIKKIRKDNGLTQAEFADRIGLSKNMIALVETDKANLSDRSVKYICKEFHVNEEWLLSGNGETYVNRTLNQEIAEFINDTMEDESDSFRKRLISALSVMDEDEWVMLEKFIDNLLKK